MRSVISVIAALLAGAALLASLGWGAPPPPTPSTPSPGVSVLPILKIPFHFASLWVVDPTKVQPVLAVAQGSKAMWPIVYDLRPKLVHLTWAPNDFPQAKIPDLVAGKGGYSLELVLNGYVLMRGPDGALGQYYAYATQQALYGCPPGKTCLGTTIQATTWYSMPAPWQLELRVWEPKLRVWEPKRVLRRDPPQLPILKPCPGNPTQLCPAPPDPPDPESAEAMKVRTTVTRSGPEVSYFTAYIYPTFQHPRCTTCHSLGSLAALKNRHATLGGASWGPGPPYDVAQVPTPRGTLLTCGGGCHYPKMVDPEIQGILNIVPGKKFDDNEWKAPGSDMGINWTGKSAFEICKIVTTNLPAAQALKHHFHDDVRLAWAVQSGMLPVGRASLPLAWPHSYFQWKEITTVWADNGFPCPK